MTGVRLRFGGSLARTLCRVTAKVAPTAMPLAVAATMCPEG